MSTAQGGPNIATDGLVFYIDAINRNSYISGSTTVNDLTKNKNNGTLVNGVGYDGNSFVFDGVNDHIRGLNTITEIGNGSFSINSWFKINNINKSNCIFSIDLFTGLNYTPGLNLLLQTEGDNISYNTPIQQGVWYNACCNFTPNVSYELFLNGNPDGFDTTTDTNPIPSLDWVVGAMWVAGLSLDRYIQGNISLVSLYNRALTSQEVLQNYNALKGRFI